MLPKVCAWLTVITFTQIYWILPMHSNITIKNLSWPHFCGATLYSFMSCILYFLYVVRCFNAWYVVKPAVWLVMDCVFRSPNSPVALDRYSDNVVVEDAFLTVPRSASTLGVVRSKARAIYSFQAQNNRFICGLVLHSASSTILPL